MISKPNPVDNPVISSIFQISCLLCLLCHILNSLEIGGIKLFYIPTAMTFILSFFIRSKNDIWTYLLSLFCLLTLLSGIVSYEPKSLGAAFSVCVIIWGFSKLRYIDVSMIIKWSVFASTLILLILLAHYFSKPTFRYQGFYNDPNYLVLSLLLLTYLNLLVLKGKPNLIFTVFIVSNLFLTMFLELLTQSRTGLACLLLLHIVSWWKNIKKRPVMVLLIISAIAAFSFNYMSEHYAKEMDFFVQKFDGRRKDDVESASEQRWKLSEQHLQFISEHPTYALLGLGPGATNSTKIPGQNKLYANRDHNTFTSAFSEHGLLCFIIYLLFVAEAIMQVKKMVKNDVYGWIRVAFITSTLIFSISVWCLNYLPFWMGLFIVMNSTYAKEIDL